MSKYWQDYTNFSLSCNLPIRLSGSVYTTLHSLGVDVISNSLKTYIRGKRIIYCDQIFEIFTSKFAIAVRDCAFSKKVNSDLHTDDIVVTILFLSLNLNITTAHKNYIKIQRKVNIHNI